MSINFTEKERDMLRLIIAPDWSNPLDPMNDICWNDWACILKKIDRFEDET